MRTSDIVQLKRYLNNAIDTAGRGEWRGFILLEKLDELGFDLTRRPPSLVPLSPLWRLVRPLLRRWRPNSTSRTA